MRKIFVRLQEGLGNQLFQYVLWQRLRERFPLDQVLLDDSRMYLGSRALGLFRVLEPEPMTTLRWFALRKAKYARRTGLEFGSRWGLNLRWIMEEDVSGWDDLCEQIEAAGDCMLQGYWQWTEVHEPWLERMGERVHRQFPADRLPKEQREWAQDAIAIHVRLGDYLHPNHKGFYITQETDYFMRAIAHLRGEESRPEVVIFSDSPDQVLQWHPALAEYPLRWAKHYCQDYIEEFLWMKDFRRVVISNSTYSYWASSIQPPGCEEKRRVFPRAYFHSEGLNAQYLAGKFFAFTPAVTLL